MSHPYVPLGTPVTITVDGFWDGDHNGNEPYMTYRGHDGQERKIHIPHGALVQTKPEEVEALEFTVDKTPKPAPIYYDVEGDEERTFHGRTFKDLGGRLWFEVSLGYVTPAATREEAEDRYAYSNTDGLGLAYVRANYGPLTDVTDTGEPLNDQRTATNDQIGSSDTPPQPGDRVRVTYEAEYEGRSRGGDADWWHWLKRDGDNQGSYATPQDADIQVIARAKPAVPEDPKCDVIEVQPDGSEHPWAYSESTGRYTWSGDSATWETLWETALDNNSKLYPLVTTRGPVIGG